MCLRSGESGGWPHVASSFGQFDLVGFAKAAAYMYRSLWLSAVPVAATDRPPVGRVRVCHIVESWDRGGDAARTLHVYAGAEVSHVRLSLNGDVLQTQPTDASRVASFANVRWVAGTLLATCIDGSTNSTIASHNRSTSGPGASIEVRVDAPSPRTGTGTALFADGADTAIVAALVRDADGRPAQSSSAVITFAVVSGPGRIIGTHSGDVRSHDANHIPARAAYHGKVRAIVRVTCDAGSPEWHRRRLREIDRDHSRLTRVIAPGDEATVEGSIMVEASSPGLRPGRAVIHVSRDPRDAVLPTAARGVAAALEIPG